MAEDVKQEEGSVQEPVFTEIEKKALDQGWRPKDEWEGDPDAWRGAKEFLDRGELFKKIDDQNRELKNLKRTLDDFSRHHTKMREVEYKRAMDDLKKQKKEALIEGDADKVIDIDERIDQVREAQKQPVPQVQEAPVLNPVFVAWKERNGWYDTSKSMRAYADTLGTELAQQGLTPQEILVEVERQVKKEFAHKFENPKRNAPSAVEGTAHRGTTSKKDDFIMSEDERRMMKRFVSSGVISEEQYIKDLKAQKGVS